MKGAPFCGPEHRHSAYIDERLAGTTADTGTDNCAFSAFSFFAFFSPFFAGFSPCSHLFALVRTCLARRKPHPARMTSTTPLVQSSPHTAGAANELATQAFIQRWQHNTASELATAQSFVIDLCELLGVAKPHPTPEQDYMFERPVTFTHGDGSTSAGRIDCYRRGHFVLEAKKLKAGSHTKGFDDGLLRARSQGEAYARALPAADGR